MSITIHEAFEQCHVFNVSTSKWTGQATLLSTKAGGKHVKEIVDLVDPSKLAFVAKWYKRIITSALRLGVRYDLAGAVLIPDAKMPSLEEGITTLDASAKFAAEVEEFTSKLETYRQEWADKPENVDVRAFILAQQLDPAAIQAEFALRFGALRATPSATLMSETKLEGIIGNICSEIAADVKASWSGFRTVTPMPISARASATKELLARLEDKCNGLAFLDSTGRAKQIAGYVKQIAQSLPQASMIGGQDYFNVHAIMEKLADAQHLLTQPLNIIVLNQSAVLPGIVEEEEMLAPAMPQAQSVAPVVEAVVPVADAVVLAEAVVEAVAEVVVEAVVEAPIPAQALAPVVEAPAPAPAPAEAPAPVLLDVPQGTEVVLVEEPELTPPVVAPVVVQANEVQAEEEAWSF